MKRIDLIEMLAERCLISKMKADKVIKTFTDAIMNSIERGEKMEIRGFGTFAPRENPSKVTIFGGASKDSSITQASTTIKFKAHKALRHVVNNGA